MIISCGIRFLLLLASLSLFTGCGGGSAPASSPPISTQSSASSSVVSVNQKPNAFQIQATKIGGTFLEVDWATVVDADGDALKFSVSVDGSASIKSTSDKNAKITNLKPNTLYLIEVVATDTAGATTPSNIYLKTRADGDEISLHDMRVQQYARQYSLFSPNNPERKKYPLVIWFHGAGGKLSPYLMGGVWPDTGSTEKFYYVMPQAINDEFETFTYWNAGMGAIKDDGLFVEKIMDELVNNSDVDPDRVYVGGMSSGGHMAFYSAYRFQKRVAALAPLSGSIATWIYYPTPVFPGIFSNYLIDKPMPIIHIHGDADTIVGLYGGLGHASWTDILHLWKKSNSITSAPTITELPDISKTDGTTVTLLQYRGPTVASDIDDYRVNGGGHSVPGEEGYANQDFVAGQAAWSFFKKHRLSDR